MIYNIGDAIISPLAWNSIDNFNAVLRGESRLQYYENLFGLPDPCFVSLIDPQDVDDRFAQLPTRTEERYTKVEKMAILAAAQALEQAHLDAAREDVLFVISTTKGNVDLLSGNTYEPERVYLWRTAQLIADYFGNPNTPMVVSNACISGCAAQLAAINQLRFGTYNYAVVVGAETLSKFVISGFQSFKALSKERCKPFDANRVGLNLGKLPPPWFTPSVKTTPPYPTVHFCSRTVPSATTAITYPDHRALPKGCCVPSTSPSPTSTPAASRSLTPTALPPRTTTTWSRSG